MTSRKVLVADMELKLLTRAEIIEQFHIRMNLPYMKYMLSLGCRLKNPVLGYELK